MTDEIALLPCPFCGKTEIYLDGSADCTGTPMAGCLECGSHIPSASRAEAIAAWNRRASQAAPAPSDDLRVETVLDILRLENSDFPLDRNQIVRRLQHAVKFAALSASPATEGGAA